MAAAILGNNDSIVTVVIGRDGMERTSLPLKRHTASPAILEVSKPNGWHLLKYLLTHLQLQLAGDRSVML